ncbi:MAG TPA: sialate O-acetylesterase [Cyclobacteriaceae bacterium]|nr:sialate O-acetylesterase [Cyclobacteriaceae bacterium]
MKAFRFFLLFSILATPCLSQVRLPKIISDGVVLQRDRTIRIWGWASANEKITVAFNGKTRKASAQADGKWSVEFPAMKAGGPFELTVTGKNRITVKNILVGDVWVCAGQSNMVHQMDIHDVTYANDIITANYPAIRHFKVPTKTDLTGVSGDVGDAAWQSAIGEEVRPFSAVAYFFAVKIYEKYKVPIGLINASVGGTPIEAWISEQGFKEFPQHLKTIGQNKDTAYVNGIERRRPRPVPPPSQPADKGLSGPKPWYAVDYKPGNWRTINIPGYWEDQGIKDLNGVVWYRREIELPKSMEGKPARMFLGRIVDANKVYVNGTDVGTTTYQYPQRRYKIAPNILKAGKNVFVIKVTNFNGKGGFVPDKPYCVFTDTDTVDLKGYWQYKVGEVFTPAPPAFQGINAQNQPTALYNGMVGPYINQGIKGILWYQGEANTGRATEYAGLQKALIVDWRERFSTPNAPFIYAQLPGFMDVNYLPSESEWATLRESQMKALSVLNSAMTVNIDLGEWNDIHPDNKKDVGERMALAALKLAYNENVVYSGPLYKEHSISGNKVTISFSHVGSGLITKDGEEVGSISIAGTDKKFVWAKSKIEGDKLVVWNDAVTEPKYVRYAWADNPDNPNLINKEGLPASPFRIEN